jgi:homoserine kinase type II
MLPGGLSMLWEDVDADAALTGRFGFASADDAAGWCRVVLAERWGIDAGDCARLVISDRNVIAWFATDRGGIVVKWSAVAESFVRLDASTRLLGELGDSGLPVAAPFRTRDDEARARVPGPNGELSLAVLPQVDGEWLDVDDTTAVRDAGAVLARIHIALARMRWDGPRLDDPGSEVLAWLRDNDVPEGPRLRQLVAAAPELDAPPQPVHNDFRAANVLTRDSSVVAVLDFDEVIVAPPVFDLAKASVYLATRFTEWGPTSAGVRARFRAGYEAVRPLSDAESAWFDIVVLWLSARMGWPTSA